MKTKHNGRLDIEEICLEYDVPYLHIKLLWNGCGTNLYIKMDDMEQFLKVLDTSHIEFKNIHPYPVVIVCEGFLVVDICNYYDNTISLYGKNEGAIYEEDN